MEITRFCDYTRYYWRHKEMPLTANGIKLWLLRFPGSKLVEETGLGDGLSTFQVLDSRGRVVNVWNSGPRYVTDTVAFIQDGFDPRVELGLEQLTPALLQSSNG